ncbi:protein APCDD1-like isoform X2 [Harmonia axyridis]|uniref:protein APCDD1-like isoform X2 n=1 Tax=Harmonia axyridis TaxID=115357 RepID=UPI001E278213|nr:protein APCDD1-like isoform X2 [Harmonia axyridis]XP_045463370.1 protein APCDD1-like isoform X2 [Harmonia axyridis]XP_045463371.1 protein APCDD1-like isoform X2 [Harmonia axyridis]
MPRFEETAQSSRCEQLVALSTSEDKQTVVDTNLELLAGTWISEGCETRPGPEYVIRHYQFGDKGNFTLIQHHYWDESCSSPKLTVTANGRLTLRNSLIQPGASTGYPKLRNITIIPQDVNAAKELDRLVAARCPGQYWKTWRRYEEHLVFENKNMARRKPSAYLSPINNYHSVNSQRNVLHASGHISCLGSLKWAFNEIKLLKIQLRPIPNSRIKKVKEMKMELLLGDIHSNAHLREVYNPTSFQQPLVKHVENEFVTVNKHPYLIRNTNSIMSNVFTNPKNPPHLLVKLKLPPYIWGEWTSTRCEIRNMGLYLKRLFYFYSEDSTWIGEHKFYADPFCSVVKFSVTAAGYLDIAGESKIIPGSYDIDFNIEKASLTVMDQRMVSDMHLTNTCGLDEWVVNVPKELSSTKGCPQLGIVLPSVLQDIVKIEMDFVGSLLLFLGQSDSDNLPSSMKERPTAFQPPLMKCGDVATYSQELRDILYDDLEFSSGNSRFLHIQLLVVALLVTVLNVLR